MQASLRRTPFAAWRAAVRAARGQLGGNFSSLLPRPRRGGAAEMAQQERIVRASAAARWRNRWRSSPTSSNAATRRRAGWSCGSHDKRRRCASRSW
jgi:hypothetical protein